MPYRIASLLPAATEMVCWLGGGDELVGVSHECDEPEWVQRLPRLTRSAVDPGLGTRATHAHVTRQTLQALSIFEVDPECLQRVWPDVLLTQDLCDVCAVPLEEVIEAVEAALGGRPRFVNLAPLTLAEIEADIPRVAAAIGREHEGRERLREWRQRILAIRDRVRGRRRVPVLTLEWLDPVFLGGAWIPDLIDAAGGVALGARSGEKAPPRRAAELQPFQPEVVLIKPCGFSLEKTLAEETLLRALLPAHFFAGARVHVADGNAYFNRPGPRILESLEILAACLHPDLFPEFCERHAASYLRLT